MGYKKERNAQLDTLVDKAEELLAVYRECGLVSTSDFIGILETLKLESFRAAHELAKNEVMAELDGMSLEELLSEIFETDEDEGDEE